jgi:hypothetical protein
MNSLCDFVIVICVQENHVFPVANRVQAIGWRACVTSAM